MRHPCERALSFWQDKHALALHRRDDYRWFIEPWYGLRRGMGFAEFCQWLDTPCGSDAFADRHWLSQHRQLRAPDGTLPDFLGRVERLDEDWRTLCERLGMPHRRLPRLNAAPGAVPGAGRIDAESRARLERRCAEDLRLGGYAAAPPRGGS